MNGDLEIHVNDLEIRSRNMKVTSWSKCQKLCLTLISNCMSNLIDSAPRFPSYDYGIRAEGKGQMVLR